MNLNQKLSKKIADGLGSAMGNSDDSAELFSSMSDVMSKLETTEGKKLRKKIKKSDITDKILTSKINKPIGKLYQIKKQESKEATGAGSAGGYSMPVFSTTKKDVVKTMNEGKEKIKGGISDNMTLNDILKKHLKKYKNLTIEQLKSQLNKGIKVELEHTDNKKIAKEIAMDHILENPKYYDNLKKIEKKEFKEATTSVSSGSYETPAAWAKSKSKKDWRGKSKTLFPGGKFVTVKEKCKTFPYCNQGDINALKLTNEGIVKKTIKKLSEKYNINEQIIEKLIIDDFHKIK